MPDDAPQLDPTIRVVSDDFLTQLDVVLALEERKRLTPVDDPAFPRLAEEVREAARLLLSEAAEQSARAEDVHVAAITSGTTTTIEELPGDLTPARLLALWREADRERQTLDPGSARWHELNIRIDALRRAYQRAYEEYR